MFHCYLQKNCFLRVLVTAVLLGNAVYSRIIAEERYQRKIRRETNSNDFSYYGDENNPAKSCAEIFKKNPRLPSGVYWLEFLRSGNNKTFKEKHYCINEEQENPNKIILVPKPAVEQMSPIQLLKGTSNSKTVKPMKEKVGSKPTAVENLTAGDPDSEPEDDEYLNEQQQWPLAITPPTKEEMRKRLEKAAQRIQDNNAQNIVQNNMNEVSDANDRQSMIQMEYSRSERKENNSLTQNPNDNYQLNNVVSESVSREKLLKELSGDKGSEKLVKQGETNVLQSQSNSTENSSYSNFAASGQNAKFPFQPSISSTSKPVQSRVKMTLLSLKKISKDVTKKNNLLTKMVQSLATETDADKRLTKKEREGLFVKPGLNRGVIETLIQKNATKINKDNDINNGSVRNFVSTRKSQKPSQIPDNERKRKEKPKYAGFNDRFGVGLPVLIGGELSIEGNPIGDPIKKPNPDELHSGLWTSEVQRMLNKLKTDASKHKEHATNRGKELFYEFVEKNENKLGNNQNHPAPPETHLSEYHPSLNYKPETNDLLFFSSPKMTKGPYPSTNNAVGENQSGETSRGNITAATVPPSNSKPEFQSSEASEAKIGNNQNLSLLKNQGQFSKSNNKPIVVVLNGFEKLGNTNETSLQPKANNSLSNNKTSQRSNSQVQVQAHANATSFSQTESHSHALSQTSQQLQPKKNKTKSQLAMEKTKAALAERTKQFNADLKADTESNYFHWAKQPPEKSPMQLRLEKITERLKGKQNGGLVSDRVEMTDDVGTVDVNSIDWSKFDEQYIPNMVEINKRLNAIPYAQYAAKKKTS